jgi:hypothetical protein
VTGRRSLTIAAFFSVRTSGTSAWFVVPGFGRTVDEGATVALRETEIGRLKRV